MSPSVWIATPNANASTVGPMALTTLPPVPNVGSNDPDDVYRARANQNLDWLRFVVYPARTIFPSDWMAMAFGSSYERPKAVTTLSSPWIASAMATVLSPDEPIRERTRPPDPNVGSRAPPLV